MKLQKFPDTPSTKNEAITFFPRGYIFRGEIRENEACHIYSTLFTLFISLHYYYTSKNRHYPERKKEQKTLLFWIKRKKTSVQNLWTEKYEFDWPASKEQNANAAFSNSFSLFFFQGRFPFKVWNVKWLLDLQK